MGYIGNPYVLYPVAGSTLLLDTYTGSTVAYSLEKLRTAYAGNCIRVRRSSDSAEQDIGFTGDVINISSLESFCSGTDGFIVTWYDQSGNANDLTRSVASQQYKIVSSGTTLTDPNNGNYAAQADGSNDFMTLGTAITLTQQYYMYTVFNRASSSVHTETFGGTGTASWRWNTGDDTYTDLPAQINIDLNLGVTGDFMISILRDSSNDIKSWLNGSAQTTVNSALGGGGTLTDFGQSGGRYTTGYYQEMIYWNTDQESNRSGIETEVNGRYSIW